MEFNKYIIEALKNKAYANKGWILSCYTVAEVSDKGEMYPYRLYKDGGGYYTHVDEHSPKEYITSIPKESESFIPPKYQITVDSDDVVNVKKKITTTAQRLLANYILLVYNFGDKIDYMDDKISFKAIEDILYERLVDNDSKEDGIYVEELMKFHKSAVYLQEFSLAFTVSATDKNTSPPPGIKTYGDKLLKEYGDKIKDPIVQAEFEAKLQEYADKYMEDDPSQNKLMKGKMRNSYKKMFLAYGAAKTFDGLTDFRKEALADGLPTDAEAHVDKINSLRTGSFLRAKGTQEGGVVPKRIASAINNYTVKEGDCGSKVTRKLVVVGSPTRYDGSYVMKSGSPVLLDIGSVKEGDEISIRDPMYCLSQGDTICSVCMGDKVAKSDKSIGLLATEIGMATLSQKLSGFHVTNLQTTEVDLLGLIT